MGSALTLAENDETNTAQINKGINVGETLEEVVSGYFTKTFLNDFQGLWEHPPTVIPKSNMGHPHDYFITSKEIF